MMSIAVQNFAFEEHLVRVVPRDGEPWFVGRDVCLCLGLKNPQDALGTLDADEKGVATTDPLSRGGEQTVVVVSEPGVYRLVFRSRKPEAERFKRWLAHEVLPKLRRGELAGALPSPSLAAEADASLLHKLHVVREARVLYGRASARSLWVKLGLPPVPPPPPTALDEAWQCLRHLLDIEVGETLVRHALALALDEDENARLLLLPLGIRVLADRDAFVVCNRHPGLTQAFKGTEWAGPLTAMRVLRRLPGASASGPHRWGDFVVRGTTLPAEVLDDGS